MTVAVRVYVRLDYTVNYYNNAHARNDKAARVYVWFNNVNPSVGRMRRVDTHGDYRTDETVRRQLILCALLYYDAHAFIARNVTGVWQMRENDKTAVRKTC